MSRGYLPPGHIHIVGDGGAGQPGEPGEPGRPGDPGPPGPSPWRTPVTWAPDSTYSALPPAHVVTYDGETYLCTTSHTSVADFDSTMFVKIAARGAPGASTEPQSTPIFIRLNGAVVDSGVVVPDTSPATFVFNDVSNAALSAVILSNIITVTGINTATNVSIVGGLYSKNGGAFTNINQTVVSGDQIQLRVTSSGNNATAVNVTLTIGDKSDTWTVTTTNVAADTTPLPFTFTDVSGVTPSTTQTSNPITVGGINAASPITVSGGSYSINNGPFVTTAGNVVNGDTVTLRVNASSQFSTVTNVVLTIGGVSDTWSVGTRSGQSDTTPEPFSFVDQNGATAGSLVTSNTITVSGINAAAAISISGGGSYSINGGAFRTTASTVNNGDQVVLQINAPASAGGVANVVLVIGGISDTWTVTTQSGASDTTPDAFTFTDVTSASNETLVFSNTITVAGLTPGVSVPVTFDTFEVPGAAYSKNGGSFTDVGTTAQNGDTFRLRLQSDPLSGASVGCRLTIGGVADTWQVTTATSSGGGGTPTVDMPTFENGPWKITMPYNQAKALSQAGDAVEYWPNDVNGVGTDLKNVDDAYLDRQTDTSIIFYAPTNGARTSGSSYVRTELREILADASNELDWALSRGGRLEATCRVRELPVLTKGSTNRCIIGQIHGPNDEPCRLYYYSDGSLRFRDDKAIPVSGSTPTEREFILLSSGSAQTNIPIDAYFTYVIEMDMTTGVRVTAHYNGTKFVATSPRSSFWTSSTEMYFKVGVYNSVGYPGQGTTNEGTGGSRVQFTRIINPTHDVTITSTSGNATG